MKKVIALEIIIVIVALVIVVPLMFSMNGASVTRYSQAVTQNDRRTITFDLKRGQTVTGWLNSTGDTNGLWFQIYGPDDNPPKIGDITYDGNHVSFTFTADVDGQYYIQVAVIDFSARYITYQYSVSSSPILGFDPLVLIGLVITIAVVLTLINALLNLYLPHRKLQTKHIEVNK
jgi:hypothetical protein